ncbi:unnamed protein product [Cercopithifilaria johnstoni]|uniref:CMP domain-containing protein n=1 Tax=Cercopithifilaria johnstoni TaxID=2874296 RepID=A0A8J2Q8P3_9BILA|nr:unnamed protein product [Cercopithifilaria johnstoni]
MSMFPVRVVVESVRPQHCLTCARDGHMLVDSYAIVSGATLLSQLVDTVLSALGMPQLAVNSKESPDNVTLFTLKYVLFLAIFFKQPYKLGLSGIIPIALKCKPEITSLGSWQFAFEKGQEDEEEKEKKMKEEKTIASIDLCIFQGEPGDFRDLR